MTLLQTLEHAVRTVPDFPKPGILFKDITPILGDPALLCDVVTLMAEPYAQEGITKVVGIEARGFILGGMLAKELGAGFVPVRKKGRLPYTTIRETYELEYGTDSLEIHIDALDEHDRVLIHDDSIATGGTAAATYRLASFSGATVIGFAFVGELDDLRGREALEEDLAVVSVLHF